MLTVNAELFARPYRIEIAVPLFEIGDKILNAVFFFESLSDLVEHGGVFKGRHRKRGGKIFLAEFRGFLCRLNDLLF